MYLERTKQKFNRRTSVSSSLEPLESLEPTSRVVFEPRPKSNSVPNINYTYNDYQNNERNFMNRSPEIREEDTSEADEEIDRFANNILTMVKSLQRQHQHEAFWNI